MDLLPMPSAATYRPGPAATGPILTVSREVACPAPPLSAFPTAARGPLPELQERAP
jgi:hypothetical protein